MIYSVYWLYASIPKNQTLCFDLPKCDLMMERFLDCGTAVCNLLVHRSFPCANLGSCMLQQSKGTQATLREDCT